MLIFDAPLFRWGSFLLPFWLNVIRKCYYCFWLLWLFFDQLFPSNISDFTVWHKVKAIVLQKCHGYTAYRGGSAAHCRGDSADLSDHVSYMLDGGCCIRSH